MSHMPCTSDAIRKRLHAVEVRLLELRRAPPLQQFHCSTLLRRLASEAEWLRAALEERRRLLAEPVVPLAAWRGGAGAAPSGIGTAPTQAVSGSMPPAC
jgi:hypothetical protein